MKEKDTSLLSETQVPEKKVDAILGKLFFLMSYNTNERLPVACIINVLQS
jgi:hypothetical protein